jgi:hypothetical protein
MIAAHDGDSRCEGFEIMPDWYEARMIFLWGTVTATMACSSSAAWGSPICLREASSGSACIRWIAVIYNLELIRMSREFMVGDFIRLMQARAEN